LHIIRDGLVPHLGAEGGHLSCSFEEAIISIDRVGFDCPCQPGGLRENSLDSLDVDEVTEVLRVA